MARRGIKTLVSERLYGYKALLASVIFFLAIGGILIPAEILSDVQWTGVAVHGANRGGLVYYSFRGQNYSIDDTSKWYSHTVYLDPDKPDSTAVLGDIYGKVLDVVVTAIPFLIALIIVCVGARRFVREQAAAPLIGEFGHGLDPEHVRRFIQKRSSEDRTSSGRTAGWAD